MILNGYKIIGKYAMRKQIIKSEPPEVFIAENEEDVILKVVEKTCIIGGYNG